MGYSLAVRTTDVARDKYDYRQVGETVFCSWSFEMTFPEINELVFESETSKEEAEEGAKVMKLLGNKADWPDSAFNVSRALCQAACVYIHACREHKKLHWPNKELQEIYDSENYSYEYQGTRSRWNISIEEIIELVNICSQTERSYLSVND